MPRNRVPSWWVTLHQAKPVWERRALVLCVEMWAGVRNTAEARPGQDWAAQGSKWGKPNPPKEGTPTIRPISRQRTEPQKENSRRPPGRIQEVPGKEKGHPGGWGWLQATPCGVTVTWNQSRAPQECVPGRGIYQAFAFSRKTDTEGKHVWRYWSFKYLKIIFQILRRQWSFNTCLIIKMTTISMYFTTWSWH